MFFDSIVGCIARVNLSSLIFVFVIVVSSPSEAEVLLGLYHPYQLRLIIWHRSEVLLRLLARVYFSLQCLSNKFPNIKISNLPLHHTHEKLFLRPLQISNWNSPKACHFEKCAVVFKVPIPLFYPYIKHIEPRASHHPHIGLPISWLCLPSSRRRALYQACN